MIRTKLHTARMASTAICGQGRHGEAWIAYDISFSGEVSGGAARSGGTASWKRWKYSWISVAPIHRPPRKLTASTPRHRSSPDNATVRTRTTASDVLVADGFEP